MIDTILKEIQKGGTGEINLIRLTNFDELTAKIFLEEMERKIIRLKMDKIKLKTVWKMRTKRMKMKGIIKNKNRKNKRLK